MKLTSVCGLFFTIAVFWVAESDANTCCFGYEPVDGLNDGNCYRLLFELGPLANNQARVACGTLFGAKLITPKSVEDTEIVQQHFLDKYGTELTEHPLAAKDTGYWTGYMRNSNLSAYEETFVNDFFDAYSSHPMPAELWRPSQPDNLRYLSNRTDEVCVSRKSIRLIGTDDEVRGLDDYPCSKQHWAICMLQGEVADLSNQNMYNTPWHNYKEGTQPNVCLENWAEQSHEMFEMLIKKDLKLGYNHPARESRNHQALGTVTVDEMTALVEDDLL